MLQRVQAPASPSWVASIGLTIAIGIAYFMAARLGLALRTNPGGVAFFWPAAGVAVGALVVLGPSAWLPGAVAVASASIATNLLIGRNTWLVCIFALVNVAQALLTSWLIDRWFGREIKLKDIRQVLGFLVASAAGAAIVAVGAAVAVALAEGMASPLPVLRLLFVGCLLGVVTVAPVLIGLGEAVRERPPRRELIEGAAALATLAVLSVVAASLPERPWATALPEILVFCPLLWVAVRCRPVFSAAGAFFVALAVICSKTFNLGYFGNASIPILDGLFAAQSFVLASALVAFVLAALFAERRRSETALKLGNELLQDSNNRLQLALGAAELGVFSLDLETGLLECDARTAHIHGHSSLPQTIKEGRRFVHADDRVCIDTRFGEAQSVRGAWSAEYRVVHPPGHPHAGEVRWVAFEGAIVPGVQSKLGRLLGISRDITDRKVAEQALAERDAQLALVGQIALVGTLTFNLSSGRMQVSPGYAAIHGLPEGTSETNRADWRARVHPDDLRRLEAHLRRDIDARRSEHYCDYRIFRSGGEIRWIEARSFILYDSDGAAQRIVGTNIDVTERKKAELALAERTLQLVLAEKTSMVGTVAYDVDAEKMQISEGYAAVHDFPEGTTEITRSEWQTRVHPEDAPRLEAVRSRAFGKRVNEYSADYRIVRPGGDIRWIEARSFISYRGDCPQRVVGINIDITERKRTEQALAERNAQFALAHKAARVGSYAYDNTKHVMRLSRSSAAIYGLSQDTIEITGKDWHTCIHRDDVDRLRAERRRAFETQQPELVGEFRIVRPGGEIRWIEARSLISYDSAGRAARMVGVYIDVTDRMRVERALLERDAQLDLANQVGRVGGYSYDHTTNTLRLGAGTAAIYGLPESTEEMTAEEWRKCVHTEDLKQLAAESRHALAKQQGELVCVFRIIRNGEVRWIETRNRFAYDKMGRVVQTIGVSIDVTERRQAEDHKNLLIAELDHRVKNVLATVSAVAGHTLEASRSMNHFVASLDGRIRSMAAAHELLSTSQWQGMPMAELVRRELAAYASNGNTKIDGPDVMLSAEAGQSMAMVIHELVTNAAKHGALSVQSGHVSVRWYRKLNGSAQLVLLWQETGGPRVRAPRNSGYGASVVRDLIPYEFGGTVDLSFAPEGVRYREVVSIVWTDFPRR